MKRQSRGSKGRGPVHPGTTLLEQYLNPMGVSQRDFARTIGLPHSRVNDTIRGRRGVTADAALRFAQALGTKPEVWLKRQLDWDLWDARNSGTAKRIQRIKRIG